MPRWPSRRPGEASLSSPLGPEHLPPPAAGHDEAATHPRPRRGALLLALAALVLLADLATKLWVVATLDDAPPVRLLGGLLTLTHSRNPGAAFSIGTSVTIVFTVVALVVVAVVLRLVPRVRSTAWAVALGLLLGGALGNLVDRLFRDPAPLRGAVVDWIRVPYWPTFNLADCGIVVGGLLAALLSTRAIGLDGTRQDEQSGDDRGVTDPSTREERPGG